MRYYSLTACILILLISCNRKEDFSGLWKIRKVEILKNNELKKVIDTGYQYWSFGKRTVIEIFDHERMQNTLHVKIGIKTIKCFDEMGKIQEVFVIRKVSRGKLALTSHQQLEDDSYNIVYYLDRVDRRLTEFKRSPEPGRR